MLIGRMLLDAGVITAGQLEAGLKEQEKSGGFICTTLVKLGFAPEEKVFGVLCRQLNLPYVRVSRANIEPSVISIVPARFAIHYKIMPLEFKDNVLTIAMADPLDIRTLDNLRLVLGIEVKSVLSGESEILEAIHKYYGFGADTLEKIMDKNGQVKELSLTREKVEELEVSTEEASVVKFVNQILSEAIKSRATDIHLEPFQNEMRMRFRIDGILYDINTPESIKYLHTSIVSRIKIMANLDIAERRLPQDGRIKIRISEEELDLRISILPTAFGEAVHIRILSSRFFLELEKLGLSPEGLKIIEEAIKKPHGIIFVTGPTGSGKSTTLYASLSRINSSGIKIITVEDPIEYQLRGVNQLQVNPQIGFTFAGALRHILRHDPDVIMVGEVRDSETAEIAIRSALTGHLVFSTLHTNDAAGAVTRLIDMGVEPFLVSSSLECLVAQRLVRLICPKCRVLAKTEEGVLRRMEDELKLDPCQIQEYEGKGCQECRFTGYRGRTGIYEILTINEPIRELILKRASSQQIKQKAILDGMLTLHQDGLRKVAGGITTFAEVMRVTQEEKFSE